MPCTRHHRTPSRHCASFGRDHVRRSLTQYEYLASRPQLVAAAGATVGALALTGLVITLVNEVPVVSWSCSVNGSCNSGDAHKQGKKQSHCFRIDLRFVMACQGEHWKPGRCPDAGAWAVRCVSSAVLPSQCRCVVAQPSSFRLPTGCPMVAAQVPKVLELAGVVYIAAFTYSSVLQPVR